MGFRVLAQVRVNPHRVGMVFYTGVESLFWDKISVLENKPPRESAERVWLFALGGAPSGRGRCGFGRSHSKFLAGQVCLFACTSWNGGELGVWGDVPVGSRHVIDTGGLRRCTTAPRPSQVRPEHLLVAGAKKAIGKLRLKAGDRVVIGDSSVLLGRKIDSDEQAGANKVVFNGTLTDRTVPGQREVAVKFDRA